MAETITGYEFRGRNKYPWREWLDGEQHVLHRGTEAQRLAGKADFSITAAKFRSATLGFAWRHYLIVSTSVPDENTVILQRLGKAQWD